MGAMPWFNYGAPDNYGSYFTDKELGNANYFKAFSYIPAENLVRDFRYNSDGPNLGEPLIPLSTPPLQHAFEYFKAGKYNPGDPSHTSDVIRAGQKLWNESSGNFRKWWDAEGRHFYYGEEH